MQSWKGVNHCINPLWRQPVAVIDFNYYGDVDVLSASQRNDKIAWYENNDSESFTAYNIIALKLITTFVYSMIPVLYNHLGSLGPPSGFFFYSGTGAIKTGGHFSVK